MNKRPTISTAILVGGLSRRMGGHPKGLIPVDGEAIVQRLVRLCDDGPCFLVGNPDGPYAELGLPVIPDRREDRGAPGGVLTALHSSTTEWTRVLSCDLPYLSKSTVKDLKPNMDADVVGYRVNGRRQFLVSLWHRRVMTSLETHLSHSNPGFRILLGALEARWIDASNVVDFTNLNTIAEAKKYGLWR